jgi:predicted dehydrogenase
LPRAWLDPKERDATNFPISERFADVPRNPVNTQSRSTVEAFERQWLAFYSLVRTGEPPRAGIDEGREDVLVCQSAARVLAARHDVEIGGEAAAQVSELA